MPEETLAPRALSAVGTLAVLTAVLSSPAPAGEAGGAEALKSAPANTWVKLHEFKTGGRAAPIFFYETAKLTPIE
ncbi:MAG: hypothetical protein ACYTGB_00730 [Planctomycetota bacterium]|jgi:hypothetical protein